jgi:hypothetical protein
MIEEARANCFLSSIPGNHELLAWPLCHPVTFPRCHGVCCVGIGLFPSPPFPSLVLSAIWGCHLSLGPCFRGWDIRERIYGLNIKEKPHFFRFKSEGFFILWGIREHYENVENHIQHPGIFDDHLTDGSITPGSTI